MVFYRKYRNQTIEELDNAQVRQSLAAILAKPENIPHAFLFTGPKGLGKTSSARIVAKVVNCTSKATGSIEPCNTCDQCLSITSGNNLDVYEIDAASNRGIDEIRDLKEKIKLSPVNAVKKVYIIDEVHMLTTEAFNALLKTLEEPPSHAMFILCTTEIHKVPSTIFSRCFNVSFTKATPEELVRSFKRIITGEQLEADDDALFAIAKMSDGGFRDGAKLLEEIVSLTAGKKITSELIEEKYHTQNTGRLILEVIQSFEKKNTQQGLLAIQTVVSQGIDMRFFMLQLIESLHDLLMEQIGSTSNSSETNSFSQTDLTHIISILSKAYSEMKYAVIVQLPLELTLVDWCSIEQSENAHQTVSPAKQPQQAQHTTEVVATEKTIVKGETISEETSLAQDNEVTIASMHCMVNPKRL
jgi:DNA polymerase-3 subunit gamma/tau